MASCEKCGREIKNYGMFLGGVRCANYCYMTAKPVTLNTEVMREILEGLVDIDWCLGYLLTDEQLRQLDDLRTKAAAILESEHKR